MLWFGLAADVERSQGRLHRAEAIAQEGFLDLARKGLSDTPREFAIHLSMAWVCYFRNDLEKALEHGAGALRYAEQVGSVSIVIVASLVLSLAHIASGRAEKVDQYIQKLQGTSKATGNQNLIASADASIAYLSAARGDFEWVEQWADRRKPSMDEPFSFVFMYECLAQARLFYWQGRYQEAANMLETLRDRCVKGNVMETVIEIDLLHSASLYALKDRARAKTVMKQALAFADAEGYIQPFVRYDPIISPILIDMAGRTPAKGRWSSHTMAILKACAIDRHSAVERNPLGTNGNGNLTSREIEILDLMAGGYRNREIADKVFISVHTVKTHTSHIFEKLGVTTRVQAIRQAEQLRFFEMNYPTAELRGIKGIKDRRE